MVQLHRLAAEAKARNLEAEVRARTLLIEQMKFTIAKSAAYGPMCATIAPSPGMLRRRPCSSTRPTAPVHIPKRILMAMPD